MSDRQQLQAEAKRLGIRANQKSEILRAEIAKLSANTSKNQSSPKKALSATNLKLPKKQQSPKKLPSVSLSPAAISKLYDEKRKAYEDANIDLVKKYELYTKELKYLSDASYYVREQSRKFIAAVPPPDDDINGPNYIALRDNPYIELKKVGSVVTDLPDDDKLPKDMFMSRDVTPVNAYRFQKNEAIDLIFQVGYELHLSDEPEYPTYETRRFVEYLRAHAKDGKFTYNVYEIVVKTPE